MTHGGITNSSQAAPSRKAPMSFRILATNKIIMKPILTSAIIFLLMLTFFACSKKIDNYPAPGDTITGSTIDEGTDSTVQTEIGGGGTRVDLLETSYDSAPVP